MIIHLTSEYKYLVTKINSPERRPAPTESRPVPQKNTQPQRRPEDLRAILSKMSQSENGKKESAKGVDEKKAPTPAKDDLRSVLSSLVQKPAETKGEQAKSPVPPPQAVPKPLSAPSSTPANQQPISRQRPTPQFSSTPKGPDEQVVRQMLRTEKHDRTPFT